MTEQEETITLTPLQKAKAKYYLKIKFDPLHIAKRQGISKTYYDKVKDTDEYKRKVSIRGKEYYQKTKDLCLLPEILLPEIL